MHRSIFFRRGVMPRIGAVLILVAAASSLASGQNRPRFYPDDPLQRDDDTEDASKVQMRPIPLTWDILFNMFRPNQVAAAPRAMSVNTIDEVPDSSWYVNRIGTRALSAADIARGPDETAGPPAWPWRLVSGKSDGVTPGFTILDPAGVRWFIKFDPPTHPELATGAEVAATKLFWALGYHVPENRIAYFSRTDLLLDEKSKIKGGNGKDRPMTNRDIDRLLAQAARMRDGRYRCVASRALPGRFVGGFLYEGTRSDDPNDIISHEHRRELRALRVFGAWLNHVDAKAINTFDSVVDVNGRQVVRHQLLDFGSTLGSAAIKAREYEEGFEYIYDGDILAKAVFSFGFYVRPYMTVSYARSPLPIGRFEGDAFDPDEWKARVVNPAHIHARADDNFWAARRVALMTDELIAAAVKTASYTNPDAERYLVETLIKRRNKIAAAYLPAMNPVVDAAMAADGALTFANAAVDAGVAQAPAGYDAAWFTYDNATQESKPIATNQSPVPRILPPAGLPTTAGAFVRVDVSAVSPSHEAWKTPVQLYFRRGAAGWQLVGLERMPKEVVTTTTAPANR